MKLFIDGALFLKLFDFPVIQTISSGKNTFFSQQPRTETILETDSFFFLNSKESKMYSEETAHSISSKGNQEKIFFQ